MRVVRALLIAVAFATRVPVRVGAVAPEELAESLTALPLVGFAIGAVSYGLCALTAPGFGDTLAAIAIVSFSALISGGLHLDGLADWFDALGGGRGDRQRMLEIMRDSRIGAHGASALILVLLAKVAALAELSGSQRLVALCAAPAAARLTAVWLLYSLPAARQDGLGRGMGARLERKHAWLACAAFLIATFWLGPALIWPSIAATAAAVALGWHANKRLGGVTGDVCGAGIELSELAFLLACRAQSG
ncbi:MAG TPA: adenosylcobinamide-GDP ribazoletransferase [Polyangiales bacterium]|nr:adenosylcobinamide-GDP ribazoletransferase [Polyangiales bacterium]